MTRLGDPIPKMVQDIRAAIEESCACANVDYRVMDAQVRVTGRDFLLKIWNLIAASPLSIGVLHEDIPQETQANIFYELGVAQAMGKETIIVKSPRAKVPSDFVRSEYIAFDGNFRKNFEEFMATLMDLADHYEQISDNIDRNPLMAIDYLRRAFLINGDDRLREKAEDIAAKADFGNRAKNSLEMLATNF